MRFQTFPTYSWWNLSHIYEVMLSIMPSNSRFFAIFYSWIDSTNVEVRISLILSSCIFCFHFPSPTQKKNHDVLASFTLLSIYGSLLLLLLWYGYAFLKSSKFSEEILLCTPNIVALQVRVCAFPASRLGLQGIGISPDCNPDDRATPRQVNWYLRIWKITFPLRIRWRTICFILLQLFNWALEPGEDDVLDRLFELGYQDAAVWAKDNPVGEIVEDDTSLVGSGIDQ